MWISKLAMGSGERAMERSKPAKEFGQVSIKRRSPVLQPALCDGVRYDIGGLFPIVLVLAQNYPDLFNNGVHHGNDN